MGGEWETVPLETLIEPDRAISYGIVQPGVPASDGIPIVRVTDIRDGRIATNEPLRVSRQIETAYARTRLRGGELLLTLVGTVGESAVVPKALAGWNTARAVAVLPVNQRVGSYWVKLALRSPKVRHIIDSRLNTTVQATLNLRDVAQLPIVLPPDPERQAIAHILGTLDEKIELNRRMSETLEAIARALFRSWFVDFDPVQAKAEGRHPQLPKEIADLFPKRLVESEIGEIPEGWEVARLGALADVLRDQENPLESPNVVFRHFSIPAFDEGQWPREERGESIKSMKSRVPAGVVLLSKLNPEIERVWLVDVEKGERAICSTEFLVFRPRPPVGRAFIYCLMRSPLFRQTVEGLVTGTSKSHQRAQVGALVDLPVIRPASVLSQQFERIAGSLLERTLNVRRESRALVALRGALLPKLISGELRVPAAERLLEETA